MIDHHLSPTVFVSYSRDDDAFVMRLKADLYAQGISTWIDREGIQPGTPDWEETIRVAIHAAHAVLFIASPNARMSRYVRDELRIAEMHRRPVYPVWITGKQWMEAVPLGWGGTQYIDAREKRYETALHEIIAALKDVSSTLSNDNQSETETTRDRSSPVFFFNEKLTIPQEFYGRVRERGKLINRTRREASTSIVGPRRIGKTWLIDYLKLVAPTELGSHFRIGYLDAASPDCHTLAGFTASILQELGASYHQDSQGLAKLKNVVKDLKSMNLIPVVCIDEFEGLNDEQEFGLGFFGELRSIAQIGLVLIVASKSPLIDIVSSSTRTSPFFNIFQQLTLKPFSAAEAEKFAQDKKKQADFTDQEYSRLLEYGQNDEQQWPPIRLQLVGDLLLDDKNLAIRDDPHYYRPNDPHYWKDFKDRLEEMYQGVLGR